MAGTWYFFCPLLDRKRQDLFLAVTVDKDLLAEAHVPEAGDDGPQVGQQDVLGDHDGPRHAQVVVRVRAVPDRLGDGAAHLHGHLLDHARHQEGVLAQRLAVSVTFGAAHRNDDQVVGLEPLVDLVHVHGLEVQPVRALHVAAFWRKLPVTHAFLLCLSQTEGHYLNARDAQVF